MKKLLLSLFALASVTLSAQDWSITRYSDGFRGFANGAYIITSKENKDTKPRLAFTVEAGAAYYWVWSVFKSNLSYEQPITTEFIYNLKESESVITTSKLSSSGSIRLVLPDNFDDEMLKSKVLHIKIGNKNFNTVIRFDVEGYEKFKWNRDREILKWEYRMKGISWTDTSTFKYMVVEEDPTPESKNLSVDPEFQNFIDTYVNIAKTQGIDLSFIYDSEVIIRFSYSGELGSNTRAKAKGSRNDKVVYIIVNKNKWNRSELSRTATMYHELSHDILNASHHKDTTRLMNTSTDLITIGDLFMALLEVFEEYKANKLKVFGPNTIY